MLRLLADSKRSSPSLLARQLRLRLVADDDSGIPRNLHNIVVSIHAIATFQALHDYLRPRVSGLLSGGTRLSGMLAALAASGFGPGSSQTAAEELRQSVSAGIPPTPATAETNAAGVLSSAPGIARRRSQRLSAKKGASSGIDSSAEPAIVPEAGSDAPISEPPTSHAGASSTDTGPSETLVHDSGFAADFTDDEVDAEVRFETVLQSLNSNVPSRFLTMMWILTNRSRRKLSLCPWLKVSSRARAGLQGLLANIVQVVRRWRRRHLTGLV
jgi:E3 ubiquitin-protein ligase TRIP12